MIGIHLVSVTEHLNIDVIPCIIKTNFSAIIVFQSRVESHPVLETQVAEKFFGWAIYFLWFQE